MEKVDTPAMRFIQFLELDTETGVSSKLRRIYTILEEMDAFLPLFIPADCTKYLKVDILSVRLEYSGYS